MNYIILNGKKSTLIEGLLIQQLPPITKPLMRTQVETIDGRDGDIVTYLGYAAYDKTISIGLHGDFDINTVISYLNSSGTVTFSNEPDKVYLYKIYNQIDFNRLIRFRTANVVMHVQPFKYSAVEKAQTFTTDFTITNTGNVISKPKLTIEGSGTINISLNGNQALVVALGDEGYITIDSETMEAYKEETLKNRLVTGNYENIALNPGRNTFTFTGTVTEVTIDKYSRWL